MMVIPITNRKIKKVLKSIEAECAASNPEGFALFGQILTTGVATVELRMGTFTKEEYLILNEMIKNRRNKEADIERNNRIAPLFL